MKTKQYYFILAVVTGILCVPVLGQVEFYPSAEESSHILPDPALVGVKLIKVAIVPPDIVLKKGTLDREELKSKVERKLKKAGINVFIPEEGFVYRLPVISSLKVRMEMFKFADSEEYVCRIQTSLSRLVNLPAKQSWSFRTDVWKTEPVMQIVSVENMSAKVAEIVVQQIDTFIHAFLSANPKGVETAGANGIPSDVAVKPSEKVAKPAPAEYKYVASKNSKVFHRPDCSSAKRISPENLVGFDGRSKTVKTGRRPCKRCKP